MQRDLSQALDQISEIRRQMVRAQVFRGYRAPTTAATGVAALVAAAVQPRIIPHPWLNLPAYLTLWGGLAVVSACVFATGMIIRCRRLASPLQNERTFEAVERFIPALVTGGILTFVFYRFIIDQMWMMPGLWAVCFAMGLFASRTLLPHGITFVAGYYTIAGCLCLIYGQRPHAFSSWEMGLTFGVGQLFCAAVLYWNLERRNARRQA